MLPGGQGAPPPPPGAFKGGGSPAPQLTPSAMLNHPQGAAYQAAPVMHTPAYHAALQAASQPILRYHPSTGVVAAQQLQQMGLGPQMAHGTPLLPGLGGTSFSQWQAGNDWKQAFESKPVSISPDVAKTVAALSDYVNSKAPIANNVAAAKQAQQASALQHEGGISGFIHGLSDLLASGHSIAGTPAAVHGGALGTATSAAGGIPLKLANEATSLPSGLVQGGEQIAPALLHDAIHPGQPSQVVPIAGKFLQNDSLFNLVTGNPAKAAQLAEQNPLNAILDVTGVGGALGRGLGGLARHIPATDLMPLARTHEVAPGFPWTAVDKPYSRNAFMYGAQKLGEYKLGQSLLPGSDSPLSLSTASRGVLGKTAQLKKMGAQEIGPFLQQHTRDVKAAVESLKAIKPKDSVVANVTPNAVAFGSDNLRNTLQNYQNELAGVHGPKPTGAHRDTVTEHIANLEAMLAKADTGGFDTNALDHATQGYQQLRLPIEAQKDALGLNADPQMQRANEINYAVSAMGARHIDPVIHPDAVAAIRVAKEHVANTDAQLQLAKDQVTKDNAAHEGASAVLTDATKRLPVSPVTDSLANHLADQRALLDASKSARQAENAHALEVAQHNHDAALADLNLVANNPDKLGGLVVPDPNARPITEGPNKGMQYRALPSAEIQAHMGDQAISHIAMTNPLRAVPRSSRRGDVTAGTGTSAPITGEAGLRGDFPAGWKQLAATHVGDVKNISNARWDQHEWNLGMRDPATGAPFTPYNWENFADQYKAQHGIELVPVPHPHDSSAITLMPKEVMNQFTQQWGLNNPGRAARLALKGTRAYVHTVLPTSMKLPIMHTVESGTRAGRVGATPFSWLLYRNTIRAMSRDAATAPDVRPAFEHIDETLHSPRDGMLNPAAVRSNDRWVSHSEWPQHYLDQATSDPHYHAALQDQLRQAGVPDHVLVTHIGPRRAGIENGSLEPGWASSAGKGYGGGSNTVHQLYVPRDKIIGIGDSTEREVFFKSEHAVSKPPISTAAQTLSDRATPGGQGAQLGQQSNENLGRLEADHGRAYQIGSSPARAWSGLAHKIIGGQRWATQLAEQAAEGVHMRQVLQQNGMSWPRAQFATKPTPELVKAAKSPGFQHQATNLTHKNMGQYANYTANQRAALRFAPFAPWYGNAMRLSYKTLPTENPNFTNLLTGTANANAAQWKAQHAGLYPDEQNYLNIGPGHWLDAAKFTPIGVDKNLFKTGGEMVLPQISGAVHALFAQDPFGGPMKGPNTPRGHSAYEPLSGPAWLHAGEALAGGVLGPAELIARSLQSHGQTLYNTSMPLLGQVQRKPGTSHTGRGLGAGFLRNMNPFTGVYSNGGSSGGSGGSGITYNTGYSGGRGSRSGSSDITYNH